MKRVKTFENYFEIHIDDIKDDENVSAYITRIIGKSSDELNLLALTSIKDKIIGMCHEFGYEITNIDKNDIEIKNNYHQYFLLNLDQIGKEKFNIFWLRSCPIRDADQETNIAYDTANEITSTVVSKLSDVFFRLKNVKAIELNCENGKMYYIHPFILDIIDKKEVSNVDLKEMASLLHDIFKSKLNIKLTGNNDFTFKKQKFRFTGTDLLKLSI